MSRLINRRGAGFAVAAFATLVVAGASARATDEPIWRGDQLIYPEGGTYSRALTDVEQRYLQEFPLFAEQRSGDSPPSGPIHCVAEYEPMDAILISWESFSTIQRQMAINITTIGDADLYVSVDSASERTSAYNSLSSYGVNMDRVHFIITTTDSVWIRDYGPRYIYEGQCRAIVDHTYNRPRPNDNLFNGAFSNYKNHGLYLIPLVHGGGNYHLNALDESHTSRLICNENPGLTDQQIIDYWMDFQNVLTTLWTPYPSSIDSTQHIDMWMQIVADDVIIISDWPLNQGSTQDNICEAAAADFISRGWTVHRTPAFKIGWTHYTYTNMVLCNDLVLLPYYTHSTVSPYNDDAEAALQAACPDKTIVPINCEAIIGSAGAIHCIVMHVPAHLGGENPTAYLKTLRGGETVEPGPPVMIGWISDDNIGTATVDIFLSTDGGATFDQEIALGEDDDGAYFWLVPNISTDQARVRIVVHDDDGNTGSDESESNFTIAGSGIPGDVNGDGVVDVQDLLLVLSAWGPCAGCPEDINGDNVVDVLDLLELLGNWS